MSNPSTPSLYSMGAGSVSVQSFSGTPYVATRDPATSDTKGPQGPWRLGQIWINSTDNDAFALTSLSASNGAISATWTNLGAAAGTVSELDGDSGTATPSGGAITVAGTAGEITTSGAGAQITIALASPMTAPGNLSVTGTLGVTGATTLAALTQVGTASINGSGTAATTIGSAAGGAVSIDSTAAVTINADEASSFSVTDALADLTLSSAGGRVIVNGEEAAANAITLLSAAGGLDANVALQMNLDSSQAAADAIRVFASDGAGGIDVDCGTGGIAIDSTGAFSIDGAAASNVTTTGAGIDLTLASVLGSVLVSSTEDAALAIRLHANGGTSETIQIHADQGTGVASIDILSDVGGITLTSGLASADAINLAASAGGVDVDGALQVNIASSQSAASALRLVASDAAGGIDVDCGTGGIAIDSTGAFSIDGAAASNITTTGAGIDLTLSSVLGSVLVSSTEDAALAIRLHANGGTSETIQIHADQGTGVASIDVLSDVGGITLTSGLASTDAINLAASAGGVDIDGALEVNITSSEAAVADAVTISASAANGGITLDAGATPGVTFTNGSQSHQMLVGSGSPNGSVSASQGSMYVDVAGATSTTILFVNTDGGTTWVGVGA